MRRRFWLIAALLAILIFTFTLAVSAQVSDPARGPVASVSDRLPDTVTPITGPVLPGWKQISPSGLHATNRAVYSIVTFNNKIYAGTESPSGGQIWRKDALNSGTDFYPVMVGGFNVISNTAIDQLFVFGSQIYASTRNETTVLDVKPSDKPV